MVKMARQIKQICIDGKTARAVQTTHEKKKVNHDRERY
jgi:hypothetical protein